MSFDKVSAQLKALGACSMTALLRISGAIFLSEQVPLSACSSWGGAGAGAASWELLAGLCSEPASEEAALLGWLLCGAGVVG